MNKKFLLILSAAVLFLDFMALDDITTGNEPSLVEEYLIIAGSVPILLAIGYFLFRTRAAG